MSWRRVRAAAGSAALMLVPVAGAAQERAPVLSPSWRLTIVQARAWGTAGATPDGRGTIAEVVGRRRLATGSRFAVEIGLQLANLRRSVRADEPAAPRPGPFADTARTLSAITPVIGLTADVVRRGGVTLSLDGALAYGLLERRSRFGDGLTVVERVGERPGVAVGITLRTATGLLIRARHLHIGTGDAALSGFAVGAGVTLF